MISSKETCGYLNLTLPISLGTEIAITSLWKCSSFRSHLLHFHLLYPIRKRSMIVVGIHMNVVPKKRKELHQTIRALVDSIREEEGCISCRL